MGDSNIPKEWGLETIAQLGNYNPTTVQTGPFGAQLHSSDYVNEGVPFILIKNLQDGGLDTTDMPHITYQDAHRLSLYALQTGDVVFSRVGRVGSCFLVEKEQEGWMISGQMLRIRLPSDAIDRHYLIHALRSKPAQDQITGASVGSTRQSINTQILESLRLVVPPLPEQRRIAEILDAADDAIRQTERVIAKLRQVKAGLLHDLLTRGLDAQGRLRDPVAHPEQFKESPLGRIPREWCCVQLQETYKTPVRDFGSFSMTNLITFLDSGIPFIKSEMVEEGHLNTKNLSFISERVHNLLFKSWVYPGNVLYSKIGSALGKAVIYDGSLGICNSNAAVAKIDLDEAIALNKYVVHLLNSSVTRKRIKQRIISLLPRLNLTAISTFEIPLPSLSEQHRISTTLDAADARIRAEEATLAKLRQVKRGLMDDLLTGRVRV